MTCLVTGARGIVGRTVIDRLRAAGIPVRAASSRPGDTALPAEVEVVGLDPQRPATYTTALDGVERVFMYAAAEGLEHFIAAAKSAGVRHIALLSSIAAEAPGNPIGDHHLGVERPLRASGLPVTILRPGAFAANARMWQGTIGSERVVRHPFPDVQQSPIHEADLADAAVTALTTPGHADRIYPLTGPQSLSFRTMVELLAAAVGEPIRLEHITYDQAAEFVYRPVLELWSRAGTGPAPVGPTVESVTGKPGRTFAEWAADHARDFR
ncbi:NAD(P)H-binding protein [Nocardia sp. CDC159]|uniref:NAD(P)H-binding protein n=1 Tax=Nocardia pulmonis TaxID=2951408 RepID=A0A9X2E3A0_9NOCA|nr:MULTISPECIES: NAD(P)H-binding protein [Nocardia]MCM6773119.1 NAD(P)H-binding protein [Nocardia pulmonis]MCM6785578.1 NAD(P)H-binding protein [Nocardia sp. CDC159]